ncbi:SprT family zinc-dependent metalloprotease [Marinomonas sp. 15G1-11]|uniref:SprT family zinc-dependent metalloprotease n=1 Tax=Marinomonas phaeophyticola TaxID=3004091 RepID=A0ABT4JPL5_9GAMM|nr:SprT family zinc-dependent metalloprotease [Marinomonas sp. 15G1-11]MCZ2720305.1 SprT family zinc-dependent metalloprotease [Marinomonas sp. 15G1-11]
MTRANRQAIGLSNDMDLLRARAVLKTYHTLAENYFGREFELPIINFKQKGRAAGTAHLSKNEIRLNYFMFQQNPDAFLEEVVPHELAHLIAFTLYGPRIRPHGIEWKLVMIRALSRIPSRTHNFATPKPDQLFDYRCACQEHQLTIRRHNKILKGTVYLCKKCREPLKNIEYH